MKKSSQIVETIPQLLTEIKEYMKSRSTSKLKYLELRQYSHSSLTTAESPLSKITTFIDTKTKFTKNTSNEECAAIMRGLLAEDRSGMADKFVVEPDGIAYVSRFAKIVDEKGLLAEIEATGEGLLVDEELLKFSCADIRKYIERLIYARMIIPVKSKNIQKAKIKQNNYEGYYLFPFPAQIKQTLPQLLAPPIPKAQFDAQSKNLEDRDQKLKRLYKTKTSSYRKEFQNICTANINRGQSRGGQEQNTESLQKIFGAWNYVNKISVPNFEREAEEWFKNRK